MAVKKRFFTKNNERVGKKSGKPRGKYHKRAQKQEIVVLTSPTIVPEKSKSPNIPQKITEKTLKIGFSQKPILLAVFVIILAILSVWQVIGLVQKSVTLQQIVAKRITVSQNMQLWGNIATKYPGYRDAYFQAATLAYKLKETTQAQAYLEKVFAIDPNYVPAQNLEKLLQ